MMHDYKWFAAGRVYICEECGTAKHKNGWFWLAGSKSKIEPPCNLSAVDQDWLASAEKPKEYLV